MQGTLGNVYINDKETLKRDELIKLELKISRD
jgi:hypothetical protein